MEDNEKSAEMCDVIEEEILQDCKKTQVMSHPQILFTSLRFVYKL